MNFLCHHFRPLSMSKAGNIKMMKKSMMTRLSTGTMRQLIISI